jgi:hypothetical protein
VSNLFVRNTRSQKYGHPPLAFSQKVADVASAADRNTRQFITFWARGGRLAAHSRWTH